MAHMRIAVYRLSSGTVQEAADIVRDGMLPVFRKQPGFVNYDVIDAGEGTLLSVSAWETSEAATAATTQAAEFVRANLANRVQLQANYVGDGVL